MNGWQDWIVLLVLVLCVVWIGRKIYSSACRMRRKESLCNSCPGGCSQCPGTSDAKWNGKSVSLAKKNKKSCCG